VEKFTLNILTYIGLGGVEAQPTIDLLTANKDKELLTLINSPGGDVFEGMSISNFILHDFLNSTAEILGICASITTPIALAHTTVKMHDGSYFVIHNPWGGVLGEAEDMRHNADILDKIKGEMINRYLSRAKNLTAEQISKMMDDETWLTAKEALEMGFVDEIINDVSLAASIDQDMLAKYKFQKVPQSLIKKEESTVSAEIETSPVAKAQETLQGEITMSSEITNVAPAGATEAVINNLVTLKPNEAPQQYAKFADYYNTLTNSETLVPKSIGSIQPLITEANPILADVEMITYEGDHTETYANAIAADFVDDSGADITLTDPDVATVEFKVKAIVGGVKVSDTTLGENYTKVAQALPGMIADSVAEKLAIAMLSEKDGSDKYIQGVLNKTADYTTQTATATDVEIVNYFDSLETKYAVNAKAYMNPVMLSKIAVLADQSKKIDLDRTAKTINGIPYVLTSLMPAPAPGKKVILFGNLKKYYCLGFRTWDGQELTVKKESVPNAFRQNLLFMSRLDGRITRPNAAKIFAYKANA